MVVYCWNLTMKMHNHTFRITPVVNVIYKLWLCVYFRCTLIFCFSVRAANDPVILALLESACCDDWKLPLVAELLTSIPVPEPWKGHDLYRRHAHRTFTPPECAAYDPCCSVPRDIVSLFSNHIKSNQPKSHLDLQANRNSSKQIIGISATSHIINDCFIIKRLLFLLLM